LVERALRTFARESRIDYDQHPEFFGGLIEYFQNLVRLDAEIRGLGVFRETIPDHYGRECPFPSMRQLMGVQQIVGFTPDERDRQRQRRQRLRRTTNEEADVALPHTYLTFKPGDGKTAPPIIADQILTHRGQRGGLTFLMPPGVLWEVANRFRQHERGRPSHQYFLEGHAPNLGIISEGMTETDVNAQMSTPVLLCPTSMLHVEKGQSRIFDRLLERQTKVLTIDELHLSGSGGGNLTKMLYRLIHQTPGLYENGRVVGMSGTPDGVGGLRGLRTSCELFVRPTEGQNSIADRLDEGDPKYRPNSLEDVSEFRGRITKLLFNPDEPERWEEHLEILRYDLHPDQLRELRRIRNDNSLTFHEKYTQSLLVIRTPWLITGNRNTPCALVDEIREQLRRDLPTSNAILITEDTLNKGIFIPHEQYPGVTLSEVIQELIAEWSQANGNQEVRFHVIHGGAGTGGVSEREREEIFEEGRTAAANGGRPKIVIFAMSQCLNVGRDLRFVDMMYLLKWPWNAPDVQQLLHRSLRAGRENVRGKAFCAQRSIEVPVLESSLHRWEDTQSAIHGDSANERALAQMLQTRETPEEDRPEVRRYLESREDRVSRWRGQLHNRGKDRAGEFWNRTPRGWEDVHITGVDTSGLGDEQRAIASLVAALERGELGVELPEGPMLHLGSSGLALERHLHRIAPRPDRQIITLEPTRHMVERGRDSLIREGIQVHPERSIVGHAVNLRRLMQQNVIQAGSMAGAVLEELNEYRWAVPTEGQTPDYGERARALQYLVRSVREGAPIFVVLRREACTRQEFRNFSRDGLESFGIEPIKELCGEVVSRDNANNPPSRLWVAAGVKRHEYTWKDVSGWLDPQDIQFTHRTDWSQQMRRDLDQEDRTRLLPYSLIHTQYTLNNDRNFDYAHALPARGEQMEHQQRLIAAARAIRRLAPTIDAWNALPANRRATLERQGITFRGRIDRPTFTVQGYEQYNFYPYDEQWNS
jgi:hypothetical protein